MVFSRLFSRTTIPIHRESKKKIGFGVNKSDVSYYEGLGCEDVRVMRTLMLPEGLDCQLTTSQKNGILGGNFTSWYSGLDSYLIAHAVNEPITNVSMGRKQPEEDIIPDITYLPYMSWREWINECGKYKVGIHMMRNVWEL